MTREELLALLDRIQSEAAAYWSAFGDEEFFARIGDAWSPAENVRHLSKSIRPVTKAMRMPRFVMRVMFGTATRPSISYDALVERYKGFLAEGGNAGRFAPSESATRDRATIMRHYSEVNAELREQIARWPERAFDRLQLPHPLMGKITVREMLYFTLYHQRHHMDVVERRRAEQLRGTTSA